MMLIGRIEKVGAWWSVEVPAAGVFTQGKTRKDAAVMLADNLEMAVDRKGFKVTVADYGKGGDVLVSSNDPAALAAYVLKYQREAHGLSLAQVTTALGASSRSAFARYEAGSVVPALDKFYELLAVVAPEMTLVIVPRVPDATKR